MIHETTDRAGAKAAEASAQPPTISAMVLYGSHGYRALNSHLFSSDASLRWLVDRHRGELIRAGAIGLIAGRVVAFLPTFDAMIVQFAREALGYRLTKRQSELDSAIADAVGTGRVPKGIVP